MNGIPKQISLWLYVAALLTMYALLGLTIGLSRLPIGGLGLLGELLIAACMLAIVLLIYMHVYWSERLVRLFLLAGFFWLGIMLLLLGADYATRFGYLSPVPSRAAPFAPPRVVQPWR